VTEKRQGTNGSPGASISIRRCVMKRLLALRGVGACVLLLGSVGRAKPLATVAGVVTDEDGNPLEGVRVQLCGIETLQEGVWKRERRLGRMPWWPTDKQGRFKIEFGEANIRYDFWLEKDGFAPTFLYGISAESDELKVVLRKGVTVTGRVTRLAEGRERPIVGVEVVLSGPSMDLSYHQESLTDPEGRYKFRACPAPEGKTWFVTCLRERVAIEIPERGPVAGPHFVVSVEVRPTKGVVQRPPRPDEGRAVRVSCAAWDAD
jgi:hypothetical protein